MLSSVSHTIDIHVHTKCVFIEPQVNRKLNYGKHRGSLIGDTGQREREQERLTSTGIELRISVWKSSAPNH